MQMRNLETGELAPPHLIGYDEDGNKIYCRADGWELLTDKGEVVDTVDDDLNYVVVQE